MAMSPELKEARQEVQTVVATARSLGRHFDRALRGYVTMMMVDLARAHPALDSVSLVVDRNEGAGGDGRLCIALSAAGKDGALVDPMLLRHADYLTKAATVLYADDEAAWRKLERKIHRRSLPPDYATGKGAFSKGTWVEPAGELPAYRQGCAGGSVLVGLDYLPDVAPGVLWLDVDMLDANGLSTDDHLGHACAAMPLATTVVQRKGFVKQLAELLAPLLSEQQGLRSWEGLVTAAAGDASLAEAKAFAARVVAAHQERSAQRPVKAR